MDEGWMNEMKDFESSKQFSFGYGGLSPQVFSIREATEVSDREVVCCTGSAKRTWTWSWVYLGQIRVSDFKTVMGDTARGRLQLRQLRFRRGGGCWHEIACWVTGKGRRTADAHIGHELEVYRVTSLWNMFSEVWCKSLVIVLFQIVRLGTFNWQVFWPSLPRTVETNFMKTTSNLPRRFLPPGSLKMLYHQWGRHDVSCLEPNMLIIRMMLEN